ncbi:MAG TPA: DUF5916 domain-containing protein [Gemmatimonadaceae bacterium]|jgi:hypothetical protein
MRALVALLAVSHVSDPGTVYSGREKKLDVPPPRVEADVAIDGELTEAVWSQAVVLTGFSQFQPVDGLPATDSTQVLVWYSPTAIHFGVRAYEAHGLVNAHLLDRDKIFTDENVQILLGTFNDGRQAMVFAVNPLGVQADGTLNEGTGSRGGGAFGSAQSAREQADLSANFVFESKGHVTPFGYQVEIRIPFKSLRYQSKDVQDWGINVVRQVQHSGQEDSWAPASRAGASFLGQSGRLIGLKDLRRGLVVDVIPEVVTRSNGAEASDGRWDYTREGPEVGGNVRWGITNNLTFNGTVNPDFAQVEADVAAISYDPRAAVSYPERRPFFLEGLENFSTPTNLVYTRQIVKPDGAAKLTGKVAGTNIAFLSALDDPTTSINWTNPDTRSNANRPLYNILRATRDLGGQSRLGLVYTDKIDGQYSNRVLGLDGRFLFDKIYTVRAQAGGSSTRLVGETSNAPLWNTSVDRNGRNFGLTYSIAATDPDFRADAGFLSRVGLVNTGLNHRFNFFGKPGGLVQNTQLQVNYMLTWQYDQFMHGKSYQDGKLHFNENTTFRGGWRGGASVLIEKFGFDDAFYSGYRLLEPTAAGFDTIPFTGVGRLNNLDFVLSLGTPQFKRFAFDLFYIWGQDENFYEWSSAHILNFTGNLSLRPIDKLRIDATYQHIEYNRKTDGSTVGIRKIPRLKVEYQIARPMFFRVVGQYDAEQQDTLYDDSRTNYAIVRQQADGSFARDVGFSRNDLRVDWLFSYTPIPGTVLFAGYGGSYEGPEHLRFRGMERTVDAFFIKLSYLFRL